jgi:endonuclease/exonuclease/phosphatase (EEP) superfamily protein YafD
MRRVLAILIGVLTIAVLGGLLDGIVWPGTALALFRPQLTLLLTALALLALVVGPRRTAIVGLVAACVGFALLVPALRDPDPAPPAGRPTVKVLSLNLWHRNDDVAAVRDLIHRERPDVVALTELTPAWARALAPVLRPYPVRAVRPAEGSSGIGVYGRPVLREPRVRELADGGRPAVEAKLALPAGGVARLLVVHPTSALLPGAEQEPELAAIRAWARERGPRAAVCGDLNATPWTRSLRDVLAGADLRAALPGGLFAGSWPALPVPLRIAVDGCLVGPALRARSELGSRVGSDHLPVLVELA